MSDPTLVRSGDVEIDLSTRIVTRAGGSIRIEPKAATVLRYLIGANGRVVWREDLLDHCWTPGDGSDEALVQAVGQLRRAFDDDARRPRFIETVPKAGYRWIGGPSTSSSAPDRRKGPSIATHMGPARAPIVIALVCLAAVAIVAASLLPVPRSGPQVEIEATAANVSGAPGRRYQIRGDPDAVQAEMRRLGLDK